jgi:hypothetical protein
MCSCKRGDDCFTSLGNTASVTRQVASFNQIHVTNRIKLILIQDTTNPGKIELTGPSNLLDEITTEVKDGKLTLDNTNTCNFVRSYNYTLTLKVYVDDLTDLSIDGIAEVTTVDTLRINQLIINHFALSDISLNLLGNRVYVRSINSAHTKLQGKVAVLDGSIEEISDLDASLLQTDEVLLDTHSPLNCYVNASKGLFVKIYNKGNIYYSKEPSEYKIVDEQLSTGRLLLK